MLLQTERQPDVEAGSWPVTVEVEYDDDGPQLVCNGYVERSDRLLGDRVFRLHCGSAIWGETLDELRVSLQAHIDAVPHVNPFTPAG